MKLRPAILPLVLFLLTAGCVSAPTLASPVPTSLPAVEITITSSTLPARNPTTAPTATIPISSTAVHGYAGALTLEQQQALAAAARAYISPTPQDALATAINLGYLGRNPNPATMCGPLALAILQDLGLVDKELPLVSFYYLNPRPGHDDRLLQNVFPPDRFEKIVHEESIGSIDYSKYPLYPGDFLYLFAGDSGSYEHMLVISRVDEAGRAFAVTNINTDVGVIVDEVMLYDPSQPGVGQFYEWTDWENRMIGRTGYGGFWLWRPLPVKE